MESHYTTSLIDPEHIIYIFRENGQEIKVELNSHTGITTASKTLRETEIDHIYANYISQIKRYKA